MIPYEQKVRMADAATPDQPASASGPAPVEGVPAIPDDARIVQLARQRPLALDGQHTRVQRDGDGLELDAGQRDQDDQRLVGLEDIDRRLPVRRSLMEELAAQAVGTLHRRASLGPHQCIELAFRHDRLRAGTHPVSVAANMVMGSRVGRSGRARLPQVS